MKVLQSPAAGPEYSPRSIIRALWKWKLTILAIWLFGAVATIVIVYSLRPSYDADVLVLVESQKIPEQFVTSTVETGLARLDMLKHRVLSNDRLWKLIEDLNLYAQERQTQTREEVLEMMSQQDITLTLERRWSANRPVAFRVGYRAWSPRIAADVANRIGRFFIDENLHEREVEASGTSQFLESQLAESKRALQEQEEKLREFKLTHNGELPQQETALLAEMAQSKAELLGIQDALNREQQNKLMLVNSLAAADATSRSRREAARQNIRLESDGRASDAVAAPPLTQSARLVAQLRALRLRYHEKHPEVERLARELARLQGEDPAPAQVEKTDEPSRVAAGVGKSSRDASATTGAQAIEKTEDATIDAASIVEQQQVDALKAQIAMASKEIENLQARRQRVLQEIAATQRRIPNLPVREQQLAAITRDYETRKANYESMLKNKLAADVAANMERWKKAERFIMLDEARPPEKPSRPRRNMLSAAGTAFWLVAAAVICFLLELRRNVLLGEWELPARVTVLGRMPKMKMSGAPVLLAGSGEISATPERI